MGKGLFFIVTLLAALPALGFDYDSFAKTLRDKKIASLEAALGELPPEFFQYYVLIRESRSTQHASGEYPRVILAGLDGRLLVAYNGDPKLPGHDSLEMIQVRGEGQRFEMRQIRFPDKQNTLKEPEFSDANPRLCLSCHRADPRPNWEQYSTWTGAYGEDDDGLMNKERDDYRSFVEKHGGEARYQRLLREGGAIAPYSDGIPNLETRPNLFFTKLVARWNAKRMTARLLKGLSGRDRLAPLAALADCTDLPEKANARLARLLDLPPGEVLDWLRKGTAKDLLKTRQGIATADWSLVFTEENPPPSPYRFDRYFDGLFDMRDLVEYDLIQALKSEFPELEPLSGMSGYYSEPSDPPRRRIMEDAVNALGGAPEPGTGEMCKVAGKVLEAVP